MLCQPLFLSCTIHLQYFSNVTCLVVIEQFPTSLISFSLLYFRAKYTLDCVWSLRNLLFNLYNILPSSASVQYKHIAITLCTVQHTAKNTVQYNTMLFSLQYYNTMYNTTQCYNTLYNTTQWYKLCTIQHKDAINTLYSTTQGYSLYNTITLCTIQHNAITLCTIQHNDINSAQYNTRML